MFEYMDMSFLSQSVWVMVNICYFLAAFMPDLHAQLSTLDEIPTTRQAIASCSFFALVKPVVANLK